MNKSGLGVLLLAAIVLFGNGCGDGKKASKSSANYWELPDDSILVRVNGQNLTKADQECLLDLTESLAETANPRIDARQKQVLRARRLRQCESEFVRKVLINELGKAQGIGFADAEQLEARASFARKVTKGRKTYEQISNALSPRLAEALDRFVDGQAYQAKCLEEFDRRNIKPVTAEEIAQRRDYFISYNKRAAATNALAWAAASNLWQRTQRYPGAFDKAVGEYEGGAFDHVSADSNMGEVDLSFFRDDDPSWKDDLLKAHPGDVLRPRLGDNGLMMVKVLDVVPADSRPDGGGPRWQLARIFWELAEEWIPQSNEELRADIEKIHAREAREAYFKKQLKALKVTYPSGTNLLKRADAKVGRSRNNLQLPAGVAVPERVRQAMKQGE